MTALLPVDHEAERGLLGAMLLGGQGPCMKIAGDGLEPEHFDDLRHREIWTAILTLLIDGTEIEVRTVAGRVRAKDAEQAAFYVDQLTHDASVIGSLRELARRIREAHGWRLKQAAATALKAAADNMDAEAMAAAESRLAAAAANRPDRRDGSPKAVVERYIARLNAPPKKGWPFPFDEITEWTRGMRPGQITFVSGPTKHGKSVFADMLLESAARAGALASLYMNEMNEDERMDRIAARHCKVPLDRLLTPSGLIAPADRARIDDWLASNTIDFRIEEAEGWSGADVARDLVLRRPDVAVLDLLDEVPLIDGLKRRETGEETFRILKQAAMTARSHLVIVGHLNRARSGGQVTVPLPVLNDIRESAMYASRSHNVIFVWREQDETTGHAQANGVIDLALARQGKPGAIAVTFEGDFQRFTTRRHDDGFDTSFQTYKEQAA